MLGRFAENKLIDGKTIGVDATTLEANAAMRSVVRRDTGEGYDEFLRGLATGVGYGDADARIWRNWIGNGRRRRRTPTGSIGRIRTPKSRR